jgi:hypothetical protein
MCGKLCEFIRTVTKIIYLELQELIRYNQPIYQNEKSVDLEYSDCSDDSDCSFELI